MTPRSILAPIAGLLIGGCSELPDLSHKTEIQRIGLNASQVDSLLKKARAEISANQQQCHELIAQVVEPVDVLNYSCLVELRREKGFKNEKALVGKVVEQGMFNDASHGAHPVFIEWKDRDADGAWEVLTASGWGPYGHTQAREVGRGEVRWVPLQEGAKYTPEDALKDRATRNIPTGTSYD